MAEVEGDGGAVGLVAEQHDLCVGGDGVVGFEVLDGGGEIARGEHGREADERDVRGDEEGCGGDGDGRGGGERVTACAQDPCGERADGEGEGGERGGESKSGEGLAGEVEEMRHGERVVADAAVREEGADVWNEGKVTRGPEAVGERGGDGEA